MRYVPLGASGQLVSVVGLGCNNFGRKCGTAETSAIIDAAQSVGVTLLDTADLYGTPHGSSEVVMGEALKGRREEFVLATKFGMDVKGANGPELGARGSRSYIRMSVEASLRRLQTDYIDLYQMHQPCPITPIEETVEALDELVREGKVRYLGHSNFNGWQIADAHWTALNAGATPFISAQNQYSLSHRDTEAEIIPACERFGLGMLPFFPLDRGLLTGKYLGGARPAGSKMETDDGFITPERMAKAEAINVLAQEWGVSMLQIAIGALAAMPAVASVISGATSPEQLLQNVEAGLWEPTAEQLVALDAAVPGPSSG